MYILLGINLVFFLLELSVGYGVHSLALVADAFHMFNDVISLCVGLWAVKVAHSKGTSKMYTYGWQRAETLGALVNGVFLVALCLSIFLEAIQRFVEPQTVSNPQLVLIVGCFGLASNIVGMFLFHEHGHSHGGSHAHSHGATDTLAAAEQGKSNTTIDAHTQVIADEDGNVANVLPQAALGCWPKSTRLSQSGGQGSVSDRTRKNSRAFTNSDEESSTIANSTSSPVSLFKSGTNASRHRRRSGGSRHRFSSIDDLPIHPQSFRNEIIAASRENRLDDIQSKDGSASEAEDVVEEDGEEPTEGTPLLRNANVSGSAERHGHKHKHPDQHDSWHVDHKHNKKPETENGGGHSHSDLNMRGVFLHVMGDALGNVGVIGTALFIWLTNFTWRFYMDPLVSLIITAIILGSAIPLCKAASRILLQAVPAGINIDAIKDDIEELPGIISCHHVHVWQLSDVKTVASLHVQVEFDFRGEGSARYMQLAREVRRCLHEHGIHSSTIQPEFCLDPDHKHASGPPSDHDSSEHGRVNGASNVASKAASIRSEPETCLLDCGDECDEGGQCCAPSVVEPDIHDEDGHTH